MEDEILLAIDLRHLLEEAGFTVVGIAPSVERAVAAVAELAPEVATLDMNLRGLSSDPVARALRAAGIPFVVTSGYTGFGKDFTGRDAPFVKKPVDIAELLQKLTTVMT